MTYRPETLAVHAGQEDAGQESQRQDSGGQGTHVMPSRWSITSNAAGMSASHA